MAGCNATYRALIEAANRVGNLRFAESVEKIMSTVPTVPISPANTHVESARPQGMMGSL